MEAKHTPGPWTLEPPPHMNGKRNVVPFEHGREFIIWTTQGHRVGLIDGPSNADKETEFWANARLIAAAPDLLAALEVAWRWQNSDLENEDEVLNIMALAIAKAKGD